MVYPQTLLVLGWGRVWKILIPGVGGPRAFQVLTNAHGLGIDLADYEPAGSRVFGGRGGVLLVAVSGGSSIQGGRMDGR